MREIEFRGKLGQKLTGDKPAGTWIYGGYYFDCSFCVDLKTVGQYTGLKDIYGVKIFEGDILRDRYGHNFTVGWHEASCRIIASYSDSVMGYEDFSMLFIDHHEVAVTGNIHDWEIIPEDYTSQEEKIC